MSKSEEEQFDNYFFEMQEEKILQHAKNTIIKTGEYTGKSWLWVFENDIQKIKKMYHINLKTGKQWKLIDNLYSLIK